MTEQNIDIKVGDVEATVAAIGVGAKVIYNNVERALTQVEVTEQALGFERKQLADAVTQYVARLQQQAEAAQTISHQGSPYKSLHEYDISDAALFYGRSEANRYMMGSIHNAHFTVLHADSGAGKTSLLKAGLMPRILTEGQVPLYVRPYQTPVHFAIKRVLMGDIAQTPNLAIASLHDFLRQVTDLLGGASLVIMLDQFEEVFTVQSPDARREFVHELATCLDDDLLPVRWVISMRTEWFGQLGGFRPHVRNPFANEHLLKALNKAEAREIIEQPALARGVTYVDGLVHTLLTDLGQDVIQPPQLQLVCAALYDALPHGQTTITHDLYTRLGEAKGILRGHLDAVLRRQVAEGDRATAKQVIDALITSDGRRALRTREALCEELALQGVGIEAVEGVLTTLTDARLLRSAELTEDDHTIIGYELAHDYLLDRIEVDEAARSRKAAKELLARELEGYEQHGTLLSPEELAIIELYLDEIVVSPSERRLIEESESRLVSRRRRSLLGVGGVIILVIVAVAAVVTALGALREAAQAQAGVAIARQTVAAAQMQQSEAESAVSTVEMMRGTAQSDIEMAEATRVQAESAAESAAAQRDLAQDELIQIFRETGAVAVADGPIAVAWDGQRPWTLGANDDRVQVLDVELGAVAWEVSVGTRPVALEWDGSRMWVANRDDDTLQIIDPADRSVSEPIAVGDRPVAIQHVDDTLWVAVENDNAVQQIDATTGEILITIPVGSGPVALEWDGRFLWVALSDTVQRVDPEIGAVTLTVPDLDEPIDLLYDGTWLWVANYSGNTLAKVDVEDGGIETFVPVGIRPRTIVSDGVNLWVANENDSTIMQVDPIAEEVLLTREMAAGPFGMVWDGFSLWVSIADVNRVYRIEPEESAVLRALPVGDRPAPMLFDDALGGLWVGNVADNTVDFVSPSSGVIISTIPVGDNPGHLLRSGAYVWVSARDSNIVQLISATGRFVQFDIPVGRSPTALAADDSSVWVAISNDSRLQRLDPSIAAVTESVAVEGQPLALLWVAERGELWIGLGGETNAIQAYYPADGSFGEPISVPASPVDMVWDGEVIWVVSQQADALSAVNPDQGEVTLTVTTPAGPIDVLLTGERLWVLGATNGQVVQIDRETGRILAQVPVRTASQAMAYDGQTLWVTNLFGDTIQQLDLRAINALADARR